jgi:uncharacterized protein
MTAPAETFDAIIAGVCTEAAAAIDEAIASTGVASITEKADLQPQIRYRLNQLLGDRALLTEQAMLLPGWDASGKLGGVDVLVRTSNGDGFALCGELKWCQHSRTLGWTLWDIFKMVAAAQTAAKPACYAIAAAPVQLWKQDEHCAPLFATGHWRSLTLFDRFRSDWADLLHGGSARPSQVPDEISTKLVANVPLAQGKWELRAIRVEGASPDALRFSRGWPTQMMAEGALAEIEVLYSKKLVAAVLEQATNRTSLIHGPRHWVDIAVIGTRLALETPGADRKVVRRFALLHDSMRENDGHDPQHGPKAAQLAEQLKHLLKLDPQQLDQLVTALTLHDCGQVTNDPTIGCCWDADRLDLPRVGITPSAHLLSTAAATKEAMAVTATPTQ